MIELAVLIAFSVLFVHACTWDGMRLDFVRYCTEHWPAWIKKPLYDCPVCMTPWYGIPFLLLYGFPYRRFDTVLLIVFAAAGINVIVQQVFIFRKNCNCGKEKPQP